LGLIVRLHRPYHDQHSEACHIKRRELQWFSVCLPKVQYIACPPPLLPPPIPKNQPHQTTCIPCRSGTRCSAVYVEGGGSPKNWFNTPRTLSTARLPRCGAGEGGGYHARGGVVRGDVIGQVVPSERLDVLRRPQDGSSQGAVLEGRGMQVIEDNLLRHSFHLG